MKAIYKSIALLFGAMSMFSSCEDFLTRDPQDSFLLKDYLSSNDALSDYTRQIYGPLTWNGFDDKFSWCVGELYSGNVYHNYSDEGEFHFMKFTSTNAHIQNGYTSLYGVIAKCNHIINDIPTIAHENGLSEEILNRVLGEAHMFRGMAYFYLAEYWGASPIVLNNSNNISNNLVAEVTRANRKSLYTLIEKDWNEAYNLLPGERQPNNHVWKASAKGMLAKLYVTMASCTANISEPEPYICDNSKGMYEKAIAAADECLKMCGDLDSDYDRMFWPGSDSKEILFALCFEQGVYAQGCSRQIQFARSMHLAGGGNAYGGEKGLTTMLFNSYEKGDKRLDGTSYYNKRDKDWYNFENKTWTPESSDENDRDDKKILDDMSNGKGYSYTLSDGSKYYYFLNPNKTIEEDERVYGNEPNSAVLNHCRKFIYAVKPKVSEFSIDLTIPLLRVADVYLLRAEAKMGKENSDVNAESSLGVDDINVVRKRAGLPAVDKCSFCKLNEPSRNSVSYDGEVNGTKITVYCDQYFPAYNLMMERRHEFALENQAWLDIKRLYYRNPSVAKDYIEAQDRSYTLVQKSDEVASKKADFARAALVYKLSVEQNKLDNSIKVQAEEGEIAIENLTFTLPVPSTVSQTGNFARIVDYSEQIENGSYPY